MEPRQLVDDVPGGVCAHGDLASVGRDGEEVGGAVEGAHTHPSTVSGEANVLNLQEYIYYSYREI